MPLFNVSMHERLYDTIQYISEYFSTKPVEKVSIYKPCPFCGGQPDTWWDDSYNHEGFNIECCVVSISTIYQDEAIDNWNTRYDECL